MKLSNLLDRANQTIKERKEFNAVNKIQERILEIEELEKALSLAKSKLEELLDTDLEDLDIEIF